MFKLETLLSLVQDAYGYIESLIGGRYSSIDDFLRLLIH